MDLRILPPMTKIFDLQTLIRENIERKDVVAMIRDALLETETKCTWKVHLVWEHADDDDLDLLDHMWGADDSPPQDDDEVSVDYRRDSEVGENDQRTTNVNDTCHTKTWTEEKLTGSVVTT